MMTFFGTALLLSVSLVYGQTGQKVAPPTDGTLQCQCTCTSAGLPNKNIYTSGNMNIVEKTPVTDKPQTDPNAKDNVATSKQTLPKVEATKIPIDKEVTQFKDVAVSMIRHSLGSGGGKRLIKTPEKNAIETSPPKIKWLHSASSKNAIEKQNPTETLNIATKPLALHQGGSTFTTTTRTLSEDVLDDLVTSQPPIVPSSSSANVFQSTGHTGTGTDTTDSNSSLDNVSMGIPNANTDNESNNINAASGVFHDFSNSAISNRNSDSVAADIGFVLDGSAPNPILSGVMSGLGGGSLGSGFIVENINSKRSGGYFVDKNLNNNPNPPQMLSGLSNPPMSAVQQSHNSVSGTTTTKATRAPATTVNRSPIKDNTNSVTGTQNNNNIPTNNGNNGKGTNNNNNKGMMNNNNKVNNNNNRRWNTNSMDKPKSQMNNRNNNNNNNNKNRPVNNNNNNNWQNNNKQNNNRNVWQKNQMKPFDILQDQKQNTGWNNNGQWGNWGTTTVSTMSYAMMGMDPLLFLGQHQL